MLSICERRTSRSASSINSDSSSSPEIVGTGSGTVPTVLDASKVVDVYAGEVIAGSGSSKSFNPSDSDYIVSVGDPIGVVVGITIKTYTGADNVSISIFIPPHKIDQ